MLAIEGDLWSTPYMTARTFLDKRCGLGGTGYIIRRDVLIEVGGFSNHLVEDYELTCRLLKKKYRIVFAPLCINYDEKPPNLTIMLGQRADGQKVFWICLDTGRDRTDRHTGCITIWLSRFAVFFRICTYNLGRSCNAVQFSFLILSVLLRFNVYLFVDFVTLLLMLYSYGVG